MREYEDFFETYWQCYECGCFGYMRTKKPT